MAVASISAQSSIGMGAVINASFGSIIEIVLYSIALTQAKGELVEGSIVGSLIAGVLLMPGFSMIGGAVRRKEQRFNARSAGVTSTMLIMAVIGVLTPTLFYEIYGSVRMDGCARVRMNDTVADDSIPARSSSSLAQAVRCRLANTPMRTVRRAITNMSALPTTRSIRTSSSSCRTTAPSSSSW